MSKNQVYFDESALEIVKEVYDLGGGTVVVDELPETGEEHTIYELHQEIQGDFPWLLTEFDRSEEYPTPRGCMIVVETLEDAQAMENPKHIDVVFWVRSESKAYQCFVGKGGIWVEFAEVVPVDNIYGSQLGYFAILKDFDYHITTSQPGEEQFEPILDGTGHFLDGTEFNYENESGYIPLVLTAAKNPIALLDSLIGRENCQDINDTSELPTAKQAVDGNMCNIDGNVLYPTNISLQNKLVYWNKPETDTYSWNSEFQYFVNLESENPAQYTGELEWNTLPLTVVNKIDLSLDLGKRNVYTFAPQPAHTEVSYWIYANGEWVNTENIGEIVMPVTSIGDYSFNNTGLDLNNFDFYINGIKVEVVQYGTFTIEPITEGAPIKYCPIGYLKGIVIPTEQDNHYTVEINFKGELQGRRYLNFFILYGELTSNEIDRNNYSEPMILEFDGLHEVVINCGTHEL